MKESEPNVFIVYFEDPETGRNFTDAFIADNEQQAEEIARSCIRDDVGYILHVERAE